MNSQKHHQKTCPTDKIFIFDFDSTFIKTESLEILAEITLANHPNKDKIYQSIIELTELAMEGKYSFHESLIERIKMLKPTKAHINEAAQLIATQISDSFLRNKQFFLDHQDSIYVLTGSFYELIEPAIKQFKLKANHIYANSFIYDYYGNVLGVDETNILTQNQGKVEQVKRLNFKQDIIVIGDGYNDYEIKEAQVATSFFCFTENITRKNVCKNADGVIENLEGLFLACDLEVENALAPSNIPKQKSALLLENIHPLVENFFLQNKYQVTKINRALSEDELLEYKDITFLGVRSKTSISEKFISNAKNLAAIGAFCIGTKHIDLKACNNNSISVFNAPFSNTRSVVELALAEIILLFRGAYDKSLKLHNKTWEKSSKNANEIRGKILGIIGYGNIGSQLSVLAENLGMQVIFYDIADKLPLGNAKSYPSMEKVLKTADVITIHVDDRASNKNLISSIEFELMQTNTVFLNLSRGFVVDEDALYNALDTGKLKGAGLDVFNHEPQQNNTDFTHPLQKFSNVILTPHIGGSTIEAQRHIGEYVTNNYLQFINQGSTIGSVNLPQIALGTKQSNIQRIIHVHANIPGILAKINNVFAKLNTNIEAQYLQTNQKLGYVITDVSHTISDTDINGLRDIEGTIKVWDL